MKLKSLAKLLLIVPLVSGLLAGCDVMDSKRIEYKSTGKLPPLEIPPDLTRSGRDDRYAVPDVSPNGVATFTDYDLDRKGKKQAGSTEVLPNVEKVRFVRDGAERWIVVEQPPEKVWPIVRDFWQENGFLLKIEMPEAGVMETDWAENRAKIADDPVRKTLGKVLDQLWSTGERDKFRTRLERGPDGKSTEIYISHRGMVEQIVARAQSSSETTMWEPRPSDPELEAEFLKRMMMRLGVEETRATAMVATATAQPRAKLDKDAGVLALDEPFDRAWRRVGLALDRVGFTVEDRDRSKGLYYVRYVELKADDGKSKGFLSKLAFWKSDDPAKAAQYQVRVSESRAASQVQVFNSQGQPESSETSRRILNLLYDQLK